MGAVFLVLTEDSSLDAVATLTILLEKMCSVFALEMPDAKPWALELRTEPPEDRHRAALTANQWKSGAQSDQRKIVDLVRYIATHLARSDAFVLFHFDSDRVYSEREESINAHRFKEVIIGRVEQLLRGKIADEHIRDTMSKLIAFVPCYCIEAWAYYNVNVLRRIASANDVAQIDEWTSEPGVVEECERPWSRIEAGKTQNRRLVETSFPIGSAIGAGKSFADAMLSLAFNEQLLRALFRLPPVLAME